MQAEVGMNNDLKRNHTEQVLKSVMCKGFQRGTAIGLMKPHATDSASNNLSEKVKIPPQMLILEVFRSQTKK